ncbi:MAG TPA: electron transfer flavoprotein subunit alpha/FixB family protein [candidate division Zixibacteria bacterium]|nr:electron transfer flavoprotein subunit alpha/FixB family protein [candidate division Zixibacteria bacterium]
MVTSLYSKESEAKDICIFLEHSEDGLAPVSLEMLSKGRELADKAGWSLTGLLLGDRVSDDAIEAFDYGADVVILVEDRKLKPFTVEAFTYAARHILDDYKPSIFLVGATMNGRDLAGRLAVRLRTGLNADCTGLRLDAKRGVLTCEVSGFGGGVLALIEMEQHRPQMATVRPGVFLPKKLNHRSQGQLIRPTIEIPDDIMRTKVLERTIGEDVDLTQTPVLVAGGRGVEGEFGMLKDLAQLLGGDYGATRPPVDDGFVIRERQIGQTGVVCRPNLAIICGISGAFHFVVGIQDAETVIAINSDPDAPIFEYADYCIVGDVHKIVPMLIESLQESFLAETLVS